MIKRMLAISLLVLMAGCSVPSKIVHVYFIDKTGKPVAVEREIPTIEQPINVAIDQLLAGPNDQETAAGMVSELPDGTRAREVKIEGDTAIVDFNSALHQYTGNNYDTQRLLAQIIYTATDIKGIKTVLIKLQGTDNFTIGSQDFLIDHPLERNDIKI